MKTRLIAIVVMPNSLALDITGPADVFSCAANIIQSKKIIQPREYEIVFASATDELYVTTDSGMVIKCATSIFNLFGQIDTLIVGGFSKTHNWSGYPELVEWLKSNSANIKRMCSVCIGAFILAESGLLKGRRATTHWKYCAELSQNYEAIAVDPNPIFVKDDKFYTSAGASAGIDLSLALVEEDLGRDISLEIAHTLVLYLRRPGNQSQFSSLLSQQLSSKKQIRDLQQWIMGNLRGNLNVERLAGQALMSTRNFARVFLSETGLTPAKYIEKLRVESSKRLLEETDFSIDQIADICGFGTTETMRKVYIRNMETTPYDYRHLFSPKN